MPRSFRAEIVGLVLLAVLAVLSLARRELFVGDETKYAQVIREMHADGAVLLPTLNGEPYTHKPPLHFWLMYAFTGIGGQRALWPYVLPAILSTVALVWLTGRVADDWVGRDLAWLSRFVLMGLTMVWGLAQVARMDLLFACLTTAGALALFRYLDGGRARDALLCGIGFGIGGLVKGPAAVLILVSLYVAESLGLRRRPKGADSLVLLVGIVVPLLWFVPAVLSAGMPYFEEIVVRQTAGRAVGSWVHGEPPWYYLVASPVIVFPWFFLLVGSMRSARSAGAATPALARCIRWILAIVVPFSLISSKLPVYMVPAFTPAAILCAWYLALPDERMSWRSLALWGHRAVFTILAVVPLVALSGGIPMKGDEASLLGVGSIRVALISMAVISIAGIVVGWKSIRVSSLALPFVFAVPVGIMLTAGASAINDYASSRLLVAALAREARPGDEIGMYYTPHLWSRDLPDELEGTRQFGLGELEEGRGPDLLAVRRDRIDRLAGVLDAYQHVSSVRFMGKTFDVYRRR